MAKKKKEETTKLEKLDGLINITELAKKYKLKESKVIIRLNEIIKEEIEINEKNRMPPLEDETLKDLTMRSFRLVMKGHLVSKAIPVQFKVIAKKEPFDYAKKRIDDLKKLFEVDKEKAIKEGIGDALCLEDKTVVYNESKGYNKGEYPEHRYIYTLILLVRRTDIEEEDQKKFGLKSLAFKVYEDGELKVFNELEEEHWYDSKIIINDLDKIDEKTYNLTGKFSSVSEFEELDQKEQEKLNKKYFYIDISPKKNKEGKVLKDKEGNVSLNNSGLVFSNTLSEHKLDLKDIIPYYEKFVNSGYVPTERYIVTVGDVVNVSDTGRAISIVDKSIESENKVVTVFDNRGDKSIKFGPRSKILIFGEVNYDRIQKKESVVMVSSKIIPRENGGYYYPLNIEKTEKIEKKTKEKKTEKKPEKPEEEKKTKKKKDKFVVDPEMVSEDIQSKIVETIYGMENGGTFEEILKESELEEDNAYLNSFHELVNREVITEENEVYNIF